VGTGNEGEEGEEMGGRKGEGTPKGWFTPCVFEILKKIPWTAAARLMFGLCQQFHWIPLPNLIQIVSVRYGPVSLVSTAQSIGISDMHGSVCRHLYLPPRSLVFHIPQRRPIRRIYQGLVRKLEAYRFS